MSDQEYGYQCRRCGAGTAYGTMISDGGQVKLWCLSCLRDALEAAPHEPQEAHSAQRTAHSKGPDPAVSGEPCAVSGRRNDDAP